MSRQKTKKEQHTLPLEKSSGLNINSFLVQSLILVFIGLVYYAFSWHLIAWCHMRNDYRDFKVHNILKIVTTGAAFIKKDHIALSAYMQQLPVNW